MTVLRSAGAATGDAATVFAQLQALHPHEENSNLFQDQPPGRTLSATTFDFITGDWLARQIKRSAAGTAVDQWGWDSREMWLPFLQDADLMDKLAHHWCKPVAAGYLPLHYRSHLAGGRLTALSKHPKPGVRPICISDARRRLVAKGLADYASRHFQQFFQRSRPNVLQFGANTKHGATHMFHLIKAQLHALPDDEHADPVVAANLDSANAFNCLTRQHLVDVLDAGCQHYAPLPQDDQHDRPVGWDILYGHLRAHYGVSGNLKFYGSDSNYIVQSEAGVQQGDPLGSLLFALAIHPLLLDIGQRHPSVFISAYADNCIITGPLSKVRAAVQDYNCTMGRAGLTLNPLDSALYIPSWLPLPAHSLPQRQWVVLHTDGSTHLAIDEHITFPLKLDGIKVLGCPIGTQVYSASQLQKTIAKVQTDLDLLNHFPHLHQRIKLAIYCCNTRISYLLQAVSLATSHSHLQQHDKMFDNFMATTLAFQADYLQSSYAQHYTRALQQFRLGIKQGGMGLTSAEMVAPAALYVSLREFRRWYQAYAEIWPQQALHEQDWLSHALASCVDSTAYFPYFTAEFDTATTALQDRWSIAVNEDSTWPQHILTNRIKETNKTNFLVGLTPADDYRIKQVSQNSCPTRSTTSDIRPALSHDRDSLRHCPMGHFSLTCPFELSNAAIHTTCALLFGYPVPHARYLQTRSGNLPVDPWADLLLNDSRHAGATRHASHDAITNIIALLASGHGVSSTACLRLVPIAEPDTMQRGDLVVTARGVLCDRPNCRCPPNLIMDFTLGHTYTSSHVLKQNTLETMEHDKCEFYTSKYHEQGLAFAPLAANTFGQLGSELLRFLWALADHAARNYVPVPVTVLPVLSAAPSSDDHHSPQVVRFKRLRGQLFVESRLHLLTAVYEAITHRVYGRTSPLQSQAQYWETLSSLSLLWSPTSPPSSQPPAAPGPSQSVPLVAPPIALHTAFYPGAVAALPTLSHLPPVTAHQSPAFAAPSPPSSPSLQLSSRAGDCSSVDGRSACPRLSPAITPLPVTPPHSSPVPSLSSSLSSPP